MKIYFNIITIYITNKTKLVICVQKSWACRNKLCFKFKCDLDCHYSKNTLKKLFHTHFKSLKRERIKH